MADNNNDVINDILNQLDQAKKSSEAEALKKEEEIKEEVAETKAEIPVNLIHSTTPANPNEKQLTGFIRKAQMDANSDMGKHLYNILKLFTAADLGSLSVYYNKLRYHQKAKEYVLEARKMKHNSYEFNAEILKIPGINPLIKG